MSDLPAGWEWTTLGEIASSVKNGIFVSRPGSNPDGVAILRISAVRAMRLDLDDLRYSGRSVDELSAADALLRPGDLLFTRYSGNPDYVGACARVPDNVGDLTYPDKIIRVRAPAVDSKYLAAAFASPAVRSSVAAVLRTTAGQVGISGSALKNVRIPMAPVAEQRRIVAALEKHLSCLDAAETFLSSARKRSALLRSSMANEASVGRLMGAAANGLASTSSYLASLAHERSKRVSRRRRKPAEMASPSEVSFPGHWALTSLDSLCWDIQYGSSAKTSSDHNESMVPVVRMGNLKDGRLNGSDLKYLPASHRDAEMLRLADGDVLFNRTNSMELVGKAAVYREAFGPALFASYLIRCRLLSKVSPDWISLIMNCSIGRHYIRSVASQQVGQANVSGTKLAAMPIPLPPPVEQERLIAIVHEVSENVDNVMAAIDAVEQRGVALRRSVLADAFAGRLLHQDPNDEPASVLLDRIRTERAASQPGRSRSRIPNQETLT